MVAVDRGLLKRIGLLWLACYAVALLGDGRAWVLSGPGFAEALLWLAILSLAALWRPASQFLASRPRSQRRLFAVVAAALLFGQLAGAAPQRTFPLVSWRMFSHPNAQDTLRFYEYVGDTADGQPITLNPARLFPPVNHTVMLGLEARAADESDESRQRLASALRAIGRMHNRLHPTTPILRVSMVRCTVDPRAPGQRQVQREPFLSVDVTDQR